MKKFRVKNFEKYQAQRRGKNVPWIKLMVNWAEDYEVAQLTDSQARQWVGLICIASRQGPELPWDTVWLRRKMGCKGNVDLKVFEKLGLISEVVDHDGISSLPLLAEGKGREVIKQEGKGSDRERKPKKKERKITSLNIYHDLFLEKFKTKPLILEKHGSMMARLEKKMGREEIIDLVKRYFNSDDQYIINSGFTIEMFASQINKLIVSKTAKSKSNGAGPGLQIGINGDKFDPETETDPALLEGDKYE